jgi:SnoaL-like domain
MSNRQVVEAYAQAIAADDLDAQSALLAEDYVLEYPQSGERIVGKVNRRAIIEHTPGRDSAKVAFGRIIGTDDEFVTSPMWNVIHLSGSGDEFQVTGTIRYPDGQNWHFVALATLRGGKIWRETDYFGPTFEAPEWRSEWVERMDGGRVNDANSIA